MKVRRIGVLSVSCFLVGACATVTDPVINQPLTTTPPSGSTTTITGPAPENPETPTTIPSTTLGPVIDEDSMPINELLRHAVSAHWDIEGILQQYYRDGQPTGYFAGPRFPLSWEGDYVSHWLGFAEIDGVGGNRGPYEGQFVGAVLLLEAVDPAGPAELFMVLDLVPVQIPGAALMAALCPDERGVPGYAAMLQLLDRGLTSIHWWEPDPVTGRLTRVDEIPDDCVHLPTAAPIVTQVGAWHAVDGDDRSQLLSINSGFPEKLDWWEFAGSTLDPYGMALLLIRNNPDSEAATVHQAWLGETLGWDYAGFPLRLIHDTIQLPPHANDTTITGLCSRGSDGSPALAVTKDPCSGAAPTQTWLIDLTHRQFIETDPSDIRCECVQGD